MPAEFWLVAGPNGAGKTTCTRVESIRRLLPRLVALNSDNLTLRELKTRGYKGFADAPFDLQRELFLLAAQATEQEVKKRLVAGEKVAVETVLSTSKYQSIVSDVLAAGGSFFLIYISLESPELALARIAARVALAGHDVPRRKVVSRWHKSLANLPWFLLRATKFWIFDNSDSTSAEPPALVATGESGEIQILSSVGCVELHLALRKASRRGE